MSGKDGWDFLNSDDNSYTGNDGSWGYKNSDGSGSFFGSDGSWGYTNPDGSGSYYGDDGSWGYKNSDGSGSFYGADGSWGYTNSDGSGAYYGSDGYSSSNSPKENTADDEMSTAEAISALGDSIVGMINCFSKNNTDDDDDDDDDNRYDNQVPPNKYPTYPRNTVNHISSSSIFCLCGRPVSANYKFCPTCGRNLKPKKQICKHCGQTLRDAAKFCSMCGRPTSPQ